jgi:hypothetical protein
MTKDTPEDSRLAAICLVFWSHPALPLGDALATSPFWRSTLPDCAGDRNLLGITMDQHAGAQASIPPATICGASGAEPPQILPKPTS